MNHTQDPGNRAEAPPANERLIEIETQLEQDPGNTDLLLEAIRYYHRFAMQGDELALDRAGQSTRQLLKLDRRSSEGLAIAGSLLTIKARRSGSLLKRIDTQVGSCNGLSTPLLVDYDSDEKVDFVYTGDLKGNLWKFDLTSNDYIDWDVAYYSGTSPQPLFQAKGPGGETQHITTKPDAMFHCERDGIMVVFATGMYLGGDDLLDTSTQKVYGIWD